MESFALPHRSVKKNILVAQAEYESNYPFLDSLPDVYLGYVIHLCFFPYLQIGIQVMLKS